MRAIYNSFYKKSSLDKSGDVLGSSLKELEADRIKSDKSMQDTSLDIRLMHRPIKKSQASIDEINKSMNNLSLAGKSNNLNSSDPKNVIGRSFEKKHGLLNSDKSMACSGKFEEDIDPDELQS